MRGATLDPGNTDLLAQISTHTPLARRDLNACRVRSFLRISTHTPLARRDLGDYRAKRRILRFLLTRLLRGATTPFICASRVKNISTHTPLARRDARNWRRGTCRGISTDTPLARRDPPAADATEERFQFLLTRLLRGATERRLNEHDQILFLLTRLLRGATKLAWAEYMRLDISTHTPLARRDRYI